MREGTAAVVATTIATCTRKVAKGSQIMWLGMADVAESGGIEARE